MLSRTATVLAVSLSLGICLVICCVIFFSVLYRQHRLYQQVRGNYERLCKTQPQKGYTFSEGTHIPPGRMDGSSATTSFYLKDTSAKMTSSMETFLGKWMVRRLDPDFQESVARIEALLFPAPPPRFDSDEDKDPSLFRNPHHYTPAEIKELLEKDKSRENIAQHIMVSIILPNVLLEGTPGRTLLPFKSLDIYNLNKFRNFRRVLYGGNLPDYILRFALDHTAEPQFGRPEREPYRVLFESLFELYFKAVSTRDLAKRRQEFERVLDRSVDHGIVALLSPSAHLEYRWGERLQSKIVVAPEGAFVGEGSVIGDQEAGLTSILWEREYVAV